jgi:DNA processing protein
MQKRRESFDAICLVALMKLRGVGRRKALRSYSPPADVVDESSHFAYFMQCVRSASLPEDEARPAWTKAKDEIARSDAAGIESIAYYDSDYPARLRDIADPPAVLFVKGNPAALHSTKSVAIVGTREPTSYGAKVAHRSGQAAASADFVVVSGLAHGCDTKAHEGCTEAEGVGVAVLAHGLDRIYPAANRALADRLLHLNGCLVSEYPIGMTPMRTAFAERDRIQSGLSDGVLVVETDLKGGTMHTVRFAEDQKRLLACVWHPERLRSEPKTQGNQSLISENRAFAVADGSDLSDFLFKLTQHCPAEPQPTTSKKIAPEEPSQMAWAF